MALQRRYTETILHIVLGPTATLVDNKKSQKLADSVYVYTHAHYAQLCNILFVR